MTIKGSVTPLPQPNLGCLCVLSPAEMAAAYVASQKGHSADKTFASNMLADLFPAEEALAAAVSVGLIKEDGSLLIATPVQERDIGAGHPSAVSWQEVKRAFAFRGLGRAPGFGNGKRVKSDLAAFALRQLYGLDTLPPTLSRGEARSELLRRIVTSFGEPFAAQVPHRMKEFKFDPMSRNIYLAFAGLKSDTVLQADAALLSAALGGTAGTVAELASTIIRAALRAESADAKQKEEAFNLDRFAESVRRLARRLETKPYAGRVAIAQVYDAGLAAGLNLGTLDDFKLHVAEAAREGLLDLERYDITGPFDASLKERSRLRLGRDERHFIVNQWI